MPQFRESAMRSAQTPTPHAVCSMGQPSLVAEVLQLNTESAHSATARKY
jgi:hypothetical protein